ncbi:MAG: right-handed parallel beta-helix repeat-containing protein [Pseudomonadota bacterium]
MLGFLIGFLGIAAGGAALGGIGRGSSNEEDDAPIVLQPAPPPQAERPQPEPQPEPQPAPPPQAERPQPEPQPEPQPAPPEPNPDPTAASVIAPTAFSNGDTLAVDGGRVTTVQLETQKEISSIEILQGPAEGNATVNPDGGIALVLSGSDYSGALELQYKANFADGSSETGQLGLDVAAPTQEAGWAQGKHYMLGEDENGDLIVETGETHREVYLTESDDGLTRSDIAALEGLQEQDITVRWLADNPEYGGSEGMAFSSDLGMEVWEHVTLGAKNGATSNWLLFENGYTYEDLSRTILTRDISGEDELHPIHITSWGDGPRAVINDELKMVNFDGSNIVVSDLTFSDGARFLLGSNILFDNVDFTGGEVNLQNLEGVTLHDTIIHDVVKEQPFGDDWSPFADRIGGLFVANTDSVLIEGSTFHHNGWAADYKEADGGMPPSMFSHNIYIQFNTTDVTFADNIVSQGASFGAQFRGGVFAYDNAFIDNNAAVNFLGGDYKGAGPIGNFTFFSDNVITSGGHKEAEMIGALTWGLVNDGQDTTLLDNIVAHLADPNDPDDIAARPIGQPGLLLPDTPFFDDTIVYGWSSPFSSTPASDLNVDGLDPSLLDQTTIQNFSRTLLSNSDSGIEDLMVAIVSRTAGDVSGADIVSYFQDGFDVSTEPTDAEDHRFIPNALGDGIRWDNAINWSTAQTPQDFSNVDLGGNWVAYGGTTTLGDLDLGSGGELSVNYGKLTVEGVLSVGPENGAVTIQPSGQFWIDGYQDDDRLVLDVNGGRFANSGDFGGIASIEVTDGQALLATDNGKMTLGAGSELRLTGSEARVGFDGDTQDSAVLQMAEGSALTFVADDEGFSTIEEFGSGAFGADAADVASGMSLDGLLQIDASAQSVEGTHTLIEVDALSGMFDDIHVYGLSDTLDAKLIFDYENDIVQLDLTAGTGEIGYDLTGIPDDNTLEQNDLWSALTEGQGTWDETPPDLHTNADEVPDLLAV